MIFGLSSTKATPTHRPAALCLALLCGAWFGGASASLSVAPALAAAAPSLLGSTGASEPAGAGSSMQGLAGPEEPIEGRVDPNTYRVGPGDQFALRYSDLMDPRILRVNPSGELLLPDAGTVSVAGLTLRDAEAKIREALRPYVRGKGFVLALARPRRFRLPVLGEVEKPGSVTLQAPVRASEAIEAAGGVSAAGARRGIQIRRGADTLLVDLVRYLNAGDLSANPLVFETDVLFVPSSGPQIGVSGAVPHAARYDFMEGDRLSVLVAIAGGTLPAAALDEAELTRVRSDGASVNVPVRLEAALADPGGADDLPLAGGDRLFIAWRDSWQAVDVVHVEGEVARPGPYPIESGVTRLLEVIERAGGFTSDADRSALSVHRFDWYADRDTAFVRLATTSSDILTPADREYLIARSKERNAVSALVGLLLEQGSASGNVTLMDGDRIVAPKIFPMISVQGAVRLPGYIPYQSGLKLGDYVRAAGGYASRADKGNTRVTLAATGRQVFPKDAGELRPGDTIWVPLSTAKNWWGITRDIVTMAGLAATIVLAIQGINN